MPKSFMASGKRGLSSAKTSASKKAKNVEESFEDGFEGAKNAFKETKQNLDDCEAERSKLSNSVEELKAKLGDLVKLFEAEKEARQKDRAAFEAEKEARQKDRAAFEGRLKTLEEDIRGLIASRDQVLQSQAAYDKLQKQVKGKYAKE